MLENFQKWHDQNLAYLGRVKALLGNTIPDQEEFIIHHVRLVEAHYARVGCLLADANSLLDETTHVFFSDQKTVEQYKTVREREIAAEGELAPIRQMRNKIEVLLRAIELRVNLCQSILKQGRGEKMIARQTS